MTPLFFRSRSGSIGVSLDAGDSLIVRTGRTLPVDPAVWEEADEELDLEELPEIQRTAVFEEIGALIAAGARDLEAAELAAAEKLAAEEEARADLLRAAALAEVFRSSPEGQAARAKLAADRRAFRSALDAGDFSQAIRALSRASRR